MQHSQQTNKPWALLSMLLGLVLFIMAWTSYDFMLRILVTISSLVLFDYGMGLLGLPTLSQLISSLIEKFKGK